MATINPVELQKHLKGIDYPAKKETLIEQAKKQGADKTMMSLLEKIADREYETPTELNKEIGNFNN